MKAPAILFVFVAAMCLLFGGCAQTGVPLPPSLVLPKPPSDLRAARKGSFVTLTWSEPTLTTDRETVRSIGPTQVCRAVKADMTACGNPVGTAAAPLMPTGKSSGKSGAKKKPTPESYIDTIPSNLESDSPNAELTYAVEVLNRNGRSAGLSNLVQIPAIRTLAPPSDLAAELTDDGVVLTWTNAAGPFLAEAASTESASASASSVQLQFRLRIYRRDEGTGKDSVAGEVPLTAGPARFLDAIEWEKTYLYRITFVSVITRPSGEIQIEGDDSAPLRVVAHDVFPPSVPAGIEAVYSGEGQKPFVDLIWAPVASADLAGYNVYRSEGNGAAVKVNSELVKGPSYRDTTVSSGKTYSYSVSAVDVRGNESARSEAASESVP